VSEIWFMRAWPRNPATGAEVAVRLAGGGSHTPYRLLGQDYWAGLASPPRFSSRLGFDDRGWTGRNTPESSALAYAPATAARRDKLLPLVWKGARVEIDAGEEGQPLTRELTGDIADAAWRDGVLAITVADLSRRYDRAILAAPFAGSGGLEGFAGAAGRLKRRSWGRVRNVEGRLLDPANNIYEFGDPAFALQAITALRDKGREGTISTVAWAGSAAATLAALIASTPAQGGGTVAPSIACAKWWTQPAGPLTADIEGEVGAGYVSTVAGIASRLVVLAGGSAIANLATADGWRPGLAGLHVDEANETWAAAIDRVTLRASLLWTVDPAGSVTLSRITFNDPVASLQGIFIEREATLPPMASRTLLYRLTHRQHGDGEISAALLAADVASATPSIDVIAPLTFTASITGAISPAEQLPKTVKVTRRLGGVDVSASTTFSILDHPGITGTSPVSIGSLGEVTIAATASIAASASIRVRTVRDGLTLDTTIGISRSTLQSSGGGGGGGTTVSDATLAGVSAATMSDISDILTVRTGSAGQIQFAASLSTIAAAASPAGNFDVYIRWRYRTVGGSWVEVPGGEVLNTFPATVESEAGFFYTTDGEIVSSPTVTGLSASTDYEVQLRGRRDSATPTKTINFAGSAVAVGS
jgi:hypothetical protein